MRTLRIIVGNIIINEERLLVQFLYYGPVFYRDGINVPCRDTINCETSGHSES
jgi:hypothetical protein